MDVQYLGSKTGNGRLQILNHIFSRITLWSSIVPFIYVFLIFCLVFKHFILDSVAITRFFSYCVGCP